MRITCPSPTAKHGGRFGMSILVDRAFTKNFHAQFSLPHFMTRLSHSGYQLTFWAKVIRSAAPEVAAEVVFLDVDEGYQWIGGAEVGLTQEWQHFAMEPVYTSAAQVRGSYQLPLPSFALALAHSHPHPHPHPLYPLPRPRSAATRFRSPSSSA